MVPAYAWMRIAAVSLAAAIPVIAAVPARFGEPHLVCYFLDPRVDECSGLAVSARSGSYFFVHNDSGDGPFVYAIDRTGETLARFTVPGASALDWEDMARGRDPAGKPVLFLADIGDNPRLRTAVVLYRIPEPTVDRKWVREERRTEAATRFELRYPDGAHDAETLLVHPTTGEVFLVTKAREGSRVYAAPDPLRPDTPNVLRKVADLRLDRFPPTAGSARDLIGALLVTGGDFAPDGKHVVLRTYTDAHEWRIPAAGLAAAFDTEPAHLPMPALRGGEAIAYARDGRSLLISNEALNAPVFELKRR
jgi:hypothetical protein